MKITLRLDDLSHEDVQSLVREHLASMLNNTPPESVHALPLEKLRVPSITFWTAWAGSELCGCGAVSELDHQHGEVKSMRTKENFLRMGVAQAILSKIIEESTTRGYKRLSLETGSSDHFVAARALYERNGFEYCGPFGDYQPDPLSVFMMREL